jgi:hypothetical protein
MSVNPSILKMFSDVAQPLATVAYTGSWREGVPGVPFYESLGNTVTVIFNQVANNYGGAFDWDTNDGRIFLDTNGDYVFSFTGYCEVNVPGATCQWFKLDTGDALGQPTPAGTPNTLIYTPASSEILIFRVTAPAGQNFEYPAQVTNATALCEVASGFIS